MTLDSAKAFYNDVSTGLIALDPAKMTGEDHAAIMAYAHSFGYDFTEEEMLEALEQNGLSLTIEEAEAIAGGHQSPDAEGAEGGVGFGVAVGVGGAAAACA